jgi:hypothetical protein
MSQPQSSASVYASIDSILQPPDQVHTAPSQLEVEINSLSGAALSNTGIESQNEHTRPPANLMRSTRSAHEHRYRERGSGSDSDPESRCATIPVSQSRKSTTKRTTRAKTLDEDTQVGDPHAVYSLLLYYCLVCRLWRGSQAWQEGCA